jgi:hypothetical protein
MLERFQFGTSFGGAGDSESSIIRSTTGFVNEFDEDDFARRPMGTIYISTRGLRDA